MIQKCFRVSTFFLILKNFYATYNYLKLSNVAESLQKPSYFSNFQSFTVQTVLIGSEIIHLLNSKVVQLSLLIPG